MRLYLTLFAAAAIIVLSSCSPGAGKDTPPMWVIDDMKTQQKYKPQQASVLFADGRASRKPVEGTVSRENYYEDEGYHFGLAAGQYVGKNPLTIDAKLLAHGQKKYNIYCAPCHSQTGDGKGMVALKAGAAFQPASLHEDRVRAYNDGELYSVASDGRRTMMGYRNQTSNHDRWAIVAYLRALQRSQGAVIDDVPENLRAEVR
jgi:mono/diheme cytochrome c family protein